MTANHQAAFGLYDPHREHDACGIGAVVNVSGKREHAIIDFGKQVLVNLHHRGAVGADEVTGDGAGILFQLPHEFLTPEAARTGVELPPAGSYGLAMVFCPPNDDKLRRECSRLLDEAVSHYGLAVI